MCGGGKGGNHFQLYNLPNLPLRLHCVRVCVCIYRIYIKVTSIFIVIKLVLSLDKEIYSIYLIGATR